MDKNNEFLSEDELSKFNEANSSFKKLEAELAYATHQLALTESRHTETVGRYQNALLSIENVQSDLVDKYKGKFGIDTNTGEIIRNNEADS